MAAHASNPHTQEGEAGAPGQPAQHCKLSVSQGYIVRLFLKSRKEKRKLMSPLRSSVILQSLPI